MEQLNPTTNYATKVITDKATQTNITTYYFRVKNATTVPSIEGRTNDTATVASVITPNSTRTKLLCLFHKMIQLQLQIY